MHVLSSSLFQNRVMIFFIFKMQDMYSSNLSRIHNIASFSERCALLPQGLQMNWLLLTRALFAQGEPHSLKPALLPACGRVPAGAREEVTQPSGKWEGRSERGPCAQPAAPSASSDAAFPQQDSNMLSTAGLGARRGLKAQCLQLGDPALISSRRQDSQIGPTREETIKSVMSLLQPLP